LSSESDAPKPKPPECAWESIDRALAWGLEDLLAAHHVDANDHPETPLLPDWPRYRMLERMGGYRALLARDHANRLIGYNAFFVQPPLRCVSTIWAINDVLYVAPEHRGIVGNTLIAKAAVDLKADHGVANLIYPGVSDTLAALLTAHGYRDVGRVMSKVL
jgi:hypothetical protein